LGRSSYFFWTKAVLFGWLFVLLSTVTVSAQKTPPAKAGAAQPVNIARVILIDEIKLADLLMPKGKPVLINFWATWCEPCREEFPDLVKLDQEFKGKIDFITVSLDDPADIATVVPRFLNSMKAEMPAYLLKTADESAVISKVSKEWRGGMPFTILYDANASAVYEREGKVDLAVVRPQIEKLVTTQKPAGQ